MKCRSIALATLFSMCLATFALAVEPKTIGWSDLAPTPVAYENPFVDLTADQLDMLRTILRAEQSKTAEAKDMARGLRADLTAQGLDVDWLFNQRQTIIERRRAAATGTNEAVVGDEVRMPGYVLPLEMKDRKVVEFLLVPTVGACIHEPPPPANQIVHVRYPDGIEIDGLFTPVWISGGLMASNSVQDLFLVDGEAQVEVSYAMTATAVSDY